MEASARPQPLPTSQSIDLLTEKIKQRLVKKGVIPTPKIIHTLRKKELQKSLRKSKRLASQSPPEPLTPSQKKSLSEEFYFQTISKEYRDFTRALDTKTKGSNLVGRRPWEPLELAEMRELASGYEGKDPIVGGKLKSEHLRELGSIFEERKTETLSLFLDDDIELEEGILEGDSGVSGSTSRRRVSDAQAIRILIDRLSAREITMKDWKFARMMKQSGLQFTEGQLLKIVGGLGDKGCWKQAMQVVDWVYSRKEQNQYKSRFVYTKLLAVLGKAIRPQEALRIFKQMRGDCHIYPDMAAYHSIAVTLGQAGMVRELLRVIEAMKEKPSRTIKNMHRKNWDPTLQPDIVVFNSVLNACVPSHQWKGVSWVFEQLRKGGLKANSATYGLAMEVMLHSEKYDLVHELFQKMKRSGESPKALTYKVLVRTFWKEGKIDEAIHTVRDMEQRGIVGSASVYYELACCLCNKGRWQEAMLEIEKLKRLRHSKPLAIAFTGMILSSMDGGHVKDCISIFKHMQDHCAPNIGTVNAMLKVYGRNDMFLEGKDLFEDVRRAVAGCSACLGDGGTPLIPDVYTYVSMLEASGRAHQWEYFEYMYKEMCISGYQLDQCKHAALLVEASKAGKWHLLEHAFDTILEAGEIPHPVLFSEMVLQAMVQDDYGKAATIVNAMVHAPFQLNMVDWTGLFEKNKDRISDEHLKKFSDNLCTGDIPERSSALELLKALHCICGCVQSTGSCGDNLSIVRVHNNSDACDSYVPPDSDTYGANGVYTTGDQELHDDNLDCDEVSLSRSNDGEGGNDDLYVLCPSCDFDDDYEASSSDNIPSFADAASNEFADCLDESLRGHLHVENATDEVQSPDVLNSEVNRLNTACDETELPSADDILQSWKEMRQKNGIKCTVRFG